MKSARGWGGNIDSGPRHGKRDDIGFIVGDEESRSAKRIANLLYDKQEYGIVAEHGKGTSPERDITDKLAFEHYLQTLDDMEQRLVQILIEEYRGPPQWYQGTYVKVVEKRIGPKKRFKQEVSRSETDYVVCLAHARKRFYEIFGTSEEAEREGDWYRDWVPTTQSMHASRSGKYERTGKYAKKK